MKKIMILIALLFFIGCDSKDKKNVNAEVALEKTQLQKVDVRMKWFFAGTMTPWFAGLEKGFFKENNIDLEILPGGPDNSSIKLVANGDNMFGVVGADEVLIAREKKIPVVAIGVFFKESPIGFIAKKETNIKFPKDWENKTIEVAYGSNAEIQYNKLKEKFAVKGIKEVPYTYSMIPFIEDKVDVSVAYIMDQVNTLQKNGIELNIMKAKDYGINPYGDVIITSEKILKENPDLVKKFIVSVRKSIEFSIKNSNEAVKLFISKNTNLNFDNEVVVWNSSIPFIIPNGDNDLLKFKQDRWRETSKILNLDNSVIENAYKNF